MARFSKDRWPAGGPVRELLAYLDELHRDAGQPSMAELGRAVSLAPSTLSGYFTGSRLISRTNLQALVRQLGGDAERAERLRRVAATAWNERRAAATPDPSEGTGEPPARPGAVPVGTGWTVVGDADGTARLDIILFDAPVNRLNRPERMVGRQHLIATVSPWLDQGARVLLHGLGGSGKTALAATIADRRVDAGKGSYLWLRTGSADEEIVLDGLVRSLSATPAGMVPKGGDARLLAVAQAISGTGVSLCVLDDVWNPAALHTMLRAIPAGVAVLVTSRLKLSVDHQVEVAGLDAEEAARLLAWHAQQDAYAAHPDAAALCRDMGNHPYAIEIAGHHLRQYALTPSELRVHIDGSPHELEMPAGFAAAGRESVRRLLDRTCEALPSAEARAALAAFGALFSGSVTPELMARFLGVGVNRARSALNSLVDVSLAKRASGARAYAVHDLTLSYARAMPGGTEDAKVTAAAVRDFVMTYAHDHEVLALDLDNILAGAELARATGLDDFVAIVEALATGGYLDSHGHTLAFLRLLDGAIEQLRDGPDTKRLHLLLSKRGNICFDRGEMDEAIAFYTDALALAPDPRRRVIVLSVIGKVLAERGLHQQSNEYFAQAYAAAQAESDELRILEQHNVAAFRQHDYARVRELTERGVALSQRLGERALEAMFLHNLGTAEFELGIEAALARHEQVRAIAVELQNDHILATSYRSLGTDYHARESFDQAREHFTEALRLYERLGQTQREAKLRALMRQFGYLS